VAQNSGNLSSRENTAWRENVGVQYRNLFGWLPR
jgi:hypothetical protein